jgi:threonine dehydrogenase-like Zn-dependent dehydrogenase
MASEQPIALGDQNSDNTSDEQALFLSEIFPTLNVAADRPSWDTVAIWGCGPVGQFAIRLGAGRDIAIDEVQDSSPWPRPKHQSKLDVYDDLMARTDERGLDSCIDAVGCKASGRCAADPVLDKAKSVVMLATDRVHVLRQTIMCCRNCGMILIPGGSDGMGDKIRSVL